MKTGFILIKNKPGKEYSILRKLENIIEIKEIYPIFGEYDFLVKIKVENIDIMGKLLIEKIRIIDGITDTITLTETLIQKNNIE
ncbi:MAG: Lrp/AsnC ligand binding domain-containing protein [Candidatus Thermoplasmatota archaeon]|jgi:DNA-binding Lrp family transcriptional regulator|nr:Lrp/AsnC ligand binding domain-containing protein [Candidatus Thermoplasmatota archaeon]MCK5301357.1 Lrp/AsnC ligand binding domain-containing protein [Thermoplasmatales archaeon]